MSDKAVRSVRHSYPPKIVERIKVLDKTCSRAEIAKELGVTRKALNTAMWRFGIKKASNDNAKKIIALFSEGLSIKEISRKIGRSYHTVYWHLDTRGFHNLNRDRDNGKLGEKQASNFLVTKGYQIIEKGKHKAYDLLIQRKEEVLAVNIKSGKNFVETWSNFQRLIKIPYPRALLYVTPEKPPRFYLLKLELMG